MESTSEDLGLGVSALAVRREMVGTTERVQIWFGTVAHPDPRPAGYAIGTASLADAELGTGAVHKVTWTAGQSLGQGFSPVSVSHVLCPTTQEPRGAAAVVGMVLADLLPAAGEELVVGTLSGDVIVYSADNMIELWRTHIHGSAGCYNSLRVADLDNDGINELYIAGSSGLWRFVRPGE